jgi:hypothetical protein
MNALHNAHVRDYWWHKFNIAFNQNLPLTAFLYMKCYTKESEAC